VLRKIFCTMRYLEESDKVRLNHHAFDYYEPKFYLLTALSIELFPSPSSTKFRLNLFSYKLTRLAV
jgi:hypothetical protein